MKILKSVGAVLAGFITIVILSTATDVILHVTGIIPQGALFDTSPLLLALFYRTVYTVIGGYVTCRLAPYAPTRHVIILAVIGTIIGSYGAYAMREFGPAWYSIGIIVLSWPALWLGTVWGKKNRIQII